MKLLAIDTSTSRASVALSTGTEVYHTMQDNLREHAQHLLPMIDKLLSQGGISLNQLNGIVLGRGPGSFTGLRIACSIVKGLAYPHDLPVYPVSSLAAIAENVFFSYSDVTPNMQVLSILDARMHEVYWNCYSVDGHHLDDQVGPISSIILTSNTPLVLAGVGFETYLSQLPQTIQQRCLQQYEVYPDARAMIRIAASGKVTPLTAGEALPVYVRNQVTQGGASNG